jgi:hypothetical protein
MAIRPRAHALLGAFLIAQGAACSAGAPGDDAGADGPRSADATSSAPDDGAADATGAFDGGVLPLTVSIQAVNDPAAPEHPLVMSAVTVRGPLVVLSPRLFLERATATGKCVFAVWVAAPGGGDFGALALTDRYFPAGDPNADCATAPADVIPRDVAPGDTVTELRGQLEWQCPRGASCPQGAPLALELSAGSSVLRLASTHGAALPPPAAVRAAEVNGAGTALAPRDLALQGALVTLAGARLAAAPGAGDTVALVTQDGAPAADTMAVDLGLYPGADCQRAALAGGSAGQDLAALTGVLRFAAGRWVVQPRGPGDVPALGCAP